jgi:PTS system nitrogen regulatory IIA component
MLTGGGETQEASAPARHGGLLDAGLVFFRLTGATREGVLAEISRQLALRGLVRDAGELAARLIKREKDGCTGVGHGIAIPHCRLERLDREIVAFASTDAPVDFGAADGIPVDLIFLVVSPADAAAAHLQAVARVSRLLRSPGLVEALRAATSAEELFEALRAAEARVVPAP